MTSRSSSTTDRCAEAGPPTTSRHPRRGTTSPLSAAVPRLAGRRRRCRDAECRRSRSSDDAGLADRLWAARESAEVVKSGRRPQPRRALSGAGQAYDFAVAAQRDPDDYAELLEDAGVKAQARAPMTPIVKLVFGIDYDKTRLTEFAAALVLCRAPGRSLSAASRR